MSWRVQDVKVHLVKVKVHLVKWKFTLSGRATCCCWLIFDLLSSASVRMSGVFLGFLAKSIRGAANGLIGVSRRPRRILKDRRKLLRGVMSTVVSRLPIQVGGLDIVKPISLISILTVCGYDAL